MQKKILGKKHVSGRPFLIAIHDFHMESSMTWTSSGLYEYLYGVRFHTFYDSMNRLQIRAESIKEHRYKHKVIPSGFFRLPDAENISGVLASNAATLSKFNRMGKLAQFGDPNVEMIRIGLCHDHDPDSRLPRQFRARVESCTYDECWGEGLNLYHNPFAKHPVDPDLFPGIAHHFFEDNRIRSLLPEFWPYNSITQLVVPITEKANK